MIVVDTSAIIAIILVEPEAERFKSVVTLAAELAIAAPTLVETQIVAQARLERAGMELVRTVVAGSGIRVVPFDEAQANLAADAWRRYGRGSGSSARLNFGDCFSYALARTLEAPLLFKGDDFVHTDVAPALAP